LAVEAAASAEEASAEEAAEAASAEGPLAEALLVAAVPLRDGRKLRNAVITYCRNIGM
jgi:hypothetical protein